MVRLDDRLARGDVIIIDGATGTELEARGVPMDKITWSGVAIFDHGDVLRRIHEDYIRAGADVITTNTFSTGRHLLEPAGYGDWVVDANRRAVEIAREARDRAADRPVAIAGSISHFIAGAADADRSTDGRWTSPAALRATFREQAETLAEAGCDLIALEMMERPWRAIYALEAAQATGLPVWIGVSCRRLDGKLIAFDYPDQDFGELLDALLSSGGQVVNVMHSLVDDTGPGLEAVKARWKGYLGAYPESGYFTMPNWQFENVISPADLVVAARGWIAQGAQIIGGCCGVGVEHIARLKQELPASVR